MLLITYSRFSSVLTKVSLSSMDGLDSQSKRISFCFGISRVLKGRGKSYVSMITCFEKKSYEEILGKTGINRSDNFMRISGLLMLLKFS